MTRIRFIPFIGIVSIGALALAGCGGGSGTTSLTGSPLVPNQSTAAGNGGQSGGNNGGQNAAGGGAGQIGGGMNTAGQNTAGLPRSAPAAGGNPGGGGWVLSAPDSIFGFPKIQPRQASLAKIQSQLTTGAPALGVSGAQVIGVYDDTTHDVYLIVAGYNGSGFDPARLTAAFDKPPQSFDDGHGDRSVTTTVPIDAGPHGGTAGCRSDVAQTAGGLAVEFTLCAWMTSTTMGSVSYEPKLDGKAIVVGSGPDVMGKVMRGLRDLAEHQS